MCGGIREYREANEQFAAILKHLDEYITYTDVYHDDRNLYISGLTLTSVDKIRGVCDLVNRRRIIFNIIEPSRNLTYVLIKEHFTPYIENNKIVWSFW